MMHLLLTLVIASTVGSREPAPSPGFRLLEWNVSDSAWIRHREESRAVLRHVDPDIVVLVQVAAGMTAGGIRDMLVGLRGPADTTWFVSSRGDGDYEHTVIASRDTIRDLPGFARVPYPAADEAAVRADIPAGEHVPPRDTVSLVRANGAMVRVGDRSALVVGVHLTCCGAPGSWRETRRRLGAAVVRKRVRETLWHESPPALVVAGDLNLVAGRAPLDTLLATVEGLPLGPMRRADAVHPDGWTDWTWDGRGTPYNGGRLDNVIYSSGSLTVVDACVWDTEFMPPDTLRAHGLAPATSANIGRHRPVVVDLRFKT
ncbi:MAG: endonuclease/exonuclease/phosphatase family protein [Gemmatimonadetes bacterium]|nr:endonuclease/exonuclease/phosphatase family protein [Gemmatimonadota bacterium]